MTATIQEYIDKAQAVKDAADADAQALTGTIADLKSQLTTAQGSVTVDNIVSQGEQNIIDLLRALLPAMEAQARAQASQAKKP